MPPVERGPATMSRPSFCRALRGIWLFTWRGQMAWRRLPLRVLSLVALPLLVYLTTSSPQTWTRGHGLFGNAPARVDALSRSLARAHTPLKPDQYEPVRRIFQEEFDRAQRESGEAASGQGDADRRSRLVRECYDRIGQRLSTVLDEGQFARFQKFEAGQVMLSRSQGNEAAWGWTGAFYHVLIDLYFFLLLPLGCVRGCGALIRDELQADTLGFLTTRPVSRAQLLAAKYLSQTAWLQIVFLLQTALFFAAGWLRHVPALVALLPLFLAAQLLAVFAWSALGTFLGLVTRRYTAVALLYGLIVEMGIGRIPTNINTLSLMRHLKTLLAHNPALQDIYEWAGAGVPLSVGALLLATGVFLGLAMVLFTFVEYHHSVEMQK